MLPSQAWEVVEITKNLRDTERQMNSDWCDSAVKCKEGYRKVSEIKKVLYTLLDEMEGTVFERSDI